MKEILSGISKTFGAKINLKYKDGYPPVINNTMVTKNVEKIAKNIIGDDVIDPYLLIADSKHSFSKYF